MCCCVRVERAVHAPGDAPQCAPRSLARRLRRIGDELEKRWMTGDHHHHQQHLHHHQQHHPHQHEHKPGEHSESVSCLSLLCAAVQVTVLLLSAGWRHL